MEPGLRLTPRLPEAIEGGLLIPRCERPVRDGGVQRPGVESVYWLTGTHHRKRARNGDAMRFCWRCTHA